MTGEEKRPVEQERSDEDPPRQSYEALYAKLDLMMELEPDPFEGEVPPF